MYKSTDFGTNWTVQTTPLTDWSGDAGGGLAMKDENNGIIIARDFRFYRTTDGGLNWTPEVPEGYYRNFEVAFVPGTADVYVTTGEDPLAIGRGSSISMDGGLNWIDINEWDELSNDGANSLSFYDPTHGLGGGFTASSVSGGIWKWIADANNPPHLATDSFSNDNAFTASPNPTSAMLQLSGKNIANVTVFDVLGKQVYANNYSALSHVEINMTALNNGVYMVKVTNAQGNVSTIKVIKQ